jgi:hypothetical protein
VASEKERTVKKKTPMKLMLSRETLRRLTSEQIQLALGGTRETIDQLPQDPPPTSDSEKICCG